MNKKGFTLMEVLGVIVLLAVIAVITMPIILGVIEDSSRNAFTRSVEEIENVVIMDYNEFARGGDVLYEFNNDRLVCVVCDNGADLELDFTGSIENGVGNITVNNGEVISLDIENDNYSASYSDGEIVTSEK